MRRSTLAAGVSLAALAGLLPAPLAPAAHAQALPARPIPHPLEVPAAFERAVQRGTRTTTGAPGAGYWQPWTDYRIRASVDPAAKRLDGAARITYHNRSPDALNRLFLYLFQNVHAPGVVRNEPAEVTGGVELRRVAVNGRALEAVQAPNAPGYLVNGTVMSVRSGTPLASGDSAVIEIEWTFRIPQQGAGGRMGWEGEDLLYLAYWYPQMAVYEDVVGWQTDPFLTAAEFHVGFGSYDYTVEAPAGWIVMGTGALANAEATLSPAVLRRWQAAARSDTVVRVVGPADFATATAPGTDGRLAWRFRADTARDVAFSVTRRSIWDAARTLVGDRDGDGRTDHTLIQSFWRESAPRWAQSVRYGQQSITAIGAFTGVPYPWPHMTAVEADGIIGGGMEFPMMTLIGGYTQAGDTALYSVTAHELAHMWVPMIVATDETRHGWMDEGTTNFNENEAFNLRSPGVLSAHLREQRQYVGAVRQGADAEVLRWTDRQQPPELTGFATYTKPAVMLATLRALLGEETFLRGYRTFLRDWRYRHPKPWDLFNAFETAAGRDLDWFWSTWYDETWTLDQAVASVTDAPDGGTVITIEDRGRAPMPVRLTLTRANGEAMRMEMGVDVWLRGDRTATVTLPAGGSPLVRVEIDAEAGFPDVDRANNVWTRP